jgi:hypothetical protein
MQRSASFIRSRHLFGACVTGFEEIETEGGYGYQSGVDLVGHFVGYDHENSWGARHVKNVVFLTH